MSKKIMGEDGNVYQMKKPFYKKVWFWLIAAIVVIGIIGASSSEDDKKESTVEKNTESKSNTSSNTGSNTSSKKKAETEKSKDTHKIGDTFDVGEMAYKVTGKSITKKIGSEYSNTNAKDVYLVVSVEIKNKGDKPVLISDDFFKLFLGKMEFSSDSSASMMANIDGSGDNLFFDNLNPGSTAKGKVIFDITQETIDAKGLQLQAQTGTFGTETGRVSLN